MQNIYPWLTAPDPRSPSVTFTMSWVTVCSVKLLQHTILFGFAEQKRIKNDDLTALCFYRQYPLQRWLWEMRIAVLEFSSDSAWPFLGVAGAGTCHGQRDPKQYQNNYQFKQWGHFM